MLVVIYSYIGPSIKTYLDETTYASLEPQFKEVKVLNEEQKQSRVTFEGEAAQQAKRSSMNESAI